MNKKLIILTVLATLGMTQAKSQGLSLDSCQEKAKRAYPLVHKYDLLEKSKEYSLSNVQKGYLPQLSISGYSTYQSQVFSLPFQIPGSTIEPIRQDQHRLYGEVVQPITDLFLLKNQKENIKIGNELEKQKVNVEMYQIRDRINQIYFGILFIDAQLIQTELLKKDLQAGLAKTNTAIENGIAIQASADILKVELLKVNQRVIELKANRKGFIDMLALFINEPINENTEFEMPAIQIQTTAINRPELKLFDVQHRSLGVQNTLVANKTYPRVSAFFQGGVGAPGLNMLNNEPSAYYITGVRMNWNISSLYTNKKERKMIQINQQSLGIQREAFLFNTQLALKQQSAEIQKMEALVDSDDEIISMRMTIKNSTKNQLENGTATANDYLIQVNAEDQARQTQIMHRIQLLQAQYKHQTIRGTN